MYEGINNNNAILLTTVISEIKPTNPMIKKIKNFLIYAQSKIILTADKE